MFRLAAKGDGYLFANRELREVIEGARAALQREVDNLEPNRLLNTAPADLAAYLVDKYRINPIDLRRDPWTVDESECRIEVSRDRERFFLEVHRGPYYIPGQRIRVVPFDGDSELFYCRPSMFTSVFPRGVIENQSLILSWDTPHDAARDLKPEIERALQAIEQQLIWVRGDLDAFNGSLAHSATEAIENRRKRLLANQGRLASLGILDKSEIGRTSTTCDQFNCVVSGDAIPLSRNCSANCIMRRGQFRHGLPRGIRSGEARLAAVCMIGEFLCSAKLFTDPFVVVIAKDNAYAADTISFDRLCEMGYIETRFGGIIAGVSEQLWRQQPKQPHTTGWLPNFQLTLHTVGQIDLAAIRLIWRRLIGW